MRLKIIACKVLFRELSLVAANSQNFTDVTYIRQGFHDTPEVLQKILQHEIDKIDAGEDTYTCKPNMDEDFDAVLLGYALCSNGIAGLSSKKYKIVVPRGHDCITMFLGSKEKYRKYFDSHKCVYWYSAGWIENTPMPGEKRYNNIRSQYIEKYGEENADYLMEMEQGWFKEYNWCTFIDWPELNNSSYKAFTRRCADFLNWNYDEITGDSTLLRDFIEGNWDDERFLIVPPGKTIEPTFDKKIIGLK